MRTSAGVAVLDANFAWTRQLFQPLARYAGVFLLEPTDFINAYQARWSPATLFRLRELAPNVYEKRYAFPPGWFSRFSRPFMRYLADDLQRQLDGGGVREPVLAISYPQYAPVADRCAFPRSVYYWSDEFRAYWPGRGETVRRLERHAVAATTLTVCASVTKAELLRAEFPAHADRITCLIHGHHPGLLPPAPLREPRPLPVDIAHLERPVLGHWGQVSGNLDARLMAEVARAMPEASFVFVGPVSVDFAPEEMVHFRALMAMANVHFIGARPYGAITSYVPSFDICLVFYRRDREFTRVMNPSKVRDYIASTRPVIATPLPDIVRLWAHLLRIAGCADEYVGHIREILSHAGDGREGERYGYAAAHTWDLAAERLWQMLQCR